MMLWLLLLARVASSQNFSCPANIAQQSFGNLDPFHQAFPSITVSPPSGHLQLGHQNYTYCCILALNDFVSNGCANTSSVEVIGLNDDSQFPCGAQWNGNPLGAPVVLGSYQWVNTNCGQGFEISEGKKLSQWLQLLVGFILPAVVFILNIPRRRAITVSDNLFPENINNHRIISAAVGAVVAMTIVALDTVIWLLTVFAVAAPLILSGLFEARLDKRVLSFLDEKEKSNRLPVALRARMLFTVLCGNLDLFPAWSDTMQLASPLDPFDAIEDGTSTQLEQLMSSQTGGHPTPDIGSNFNFDNTTDKEERRHSSRATSYLDPRSVESDGPHELTTVQTTSTFSPSEKTCVESCVRPCSKRTESSSLLDSTDPVSSVPGDLETRHNAGRYRTEQCDLENVRERGISGDDQDWRNVIHDMSSCLTSMLACQYSFGPVIGAPVLFYIGSFLYALLDMRQNYGSSDAAHALAFGMWWMVIPHVAIISGLLLGGNNPSALMGLVRAEKSKYHVGDQVTKSSPIRRKSTFESFREDQTSRPLYAKAYELVYEAAYKPAEMWNRGRSKQRWLLVLYVDSLSKYQNKGKVFREDVKPNMDQLLAETIILSPLEWVYLVFMAFSLVVVPCILGYLLSYWTPQVGLSCRSFTFTIYMSAQALLVVLWAIRTTARDTYWRQGARIKKRLAQRNEQKFWEEVERLKDMAIRDTTTGPSSRRKSVLPKRKALVDEERSEQASQNSTTTPKKSGTFTLQGLLDATYYFFSVIGFGLSIFSAIGGTLMQILGVYRNDICDINIPYWLPGHRARAWLHLSSNSPEAIKRAMGSWTNLGIVSVVVLVACCYIGWWYQRRLRTHFKLVAGRLDRFADR